MKKLRLLVFLLLPIITFSSVDFIISPKTRKFKKACEQAQGRFEKFKKKSHCYCDNQEDQSYFSINPNKRDCGLVKSFGKDLHEDKLKCTLPSEYFCSPTLNPHFYDYKAEYKKQEIKVSEFRKHLNLKYKKFKFLNFDKAKRERKIEQELSKKFFNQENWKVSLNAFSKSKADLLSYIDKNIPKETNGLERMKQNISKAKLKYGFSDKYHNFDFSIYQYKGDIFLSASIFNTNYNSLYFIFLHELAHTIDPCRFSAFDSQYSTNPFKKVLHCLHQEDTTQAHKADLACYDSFLKNKRDNNEKLTVGTRLFLQTYKKGSVCNLNAPLSLRYHAKKCKSTQINEVFADWLATEVFYENLENIHSINSQKKLSESVSWACKNNFYLETFQDEVAHSNSVSMHQQHFTDRMNNLFFNHPKFREAYSCEKYGKALRKDVLKLKSVDEILEYTKYSNYCSI